jgi:hypothetical protein
MSYVRGLSNLLLAKGIWGKQKVTGAKKNPSRLARVFACYGSFGLSQEENSYESSPVVIVMLTLPVWAKISVMVRSWSSATG